MAAKLEKLYSILKTSSDWHSSKSLAQLIGVSERTIRNYVNEINKEEELIESSPKGYRLIKDSSVSFSVNEVEERQNYIISCLLNNKDGFNIFDTAETMNVSESTILNTILPPIKKNLQNFGLKIESRNHQYYLVGEEKNKRRYIGHLVIHNSYDFFSSRDTLEKIFPEMKVQNVINSLYEIFQDSELLLNNYSLNNLLIHLLVLYIRMESENDLPSIAKENDPNTLINSRGDRKEIINTADKVSKCFKNFSSKEVNENDYYQIVLFIALSLDCENTHIEDVIDKSFIESIQSLLNEMAKRYGIPTIGNEFIKQFSLHMYNALQRSLFSYSYPNPVGAQIKKDFAPVYDMAVYFSHRFSSRYSITLNEDEIAFIAIHIGAYLEENSRSNHINAILITENYHGISTKLVHQMKQIMDENCTTLSVYPLTKFKSLNLACDLLISTIDFKNSHPHYILIDPIVTKRDIQKITQELEEIEDEKKREKGLDFLLSLFSEKLYFRNIRKNSKDEYIHFIGNHCIQNGIVKPAFIDDVLLRESLSSTAFADNLAIPHTISQYAEHSFIGVIHNDSPISWGNKTVRFIFMIGISEQDMKYFKDAFDILVDIFCDNQKTIELLNTNSFDDFLALIK